MSREKGNSKGVIRLLGGGALLLLFIILFRMFVINTYYVGMHGELPDGVRHKSLLLVALQKEPAASNDLLVVTLYDDEGNRQLLPARLIQSSTVHPSQELLVDIGTSDIWILRKQVHGTVVGQIKLP